MGLEAIGGDLLTGWMNNAAADARQKDAQAFSAQQFATRYQTTVKDMEAAGLNPMLAYGQGGGTPPSSSAASSAGTPSLGSSYNQSKLVTAQESNLAANTDKAKQEELTSSAQEGVNKAQARNLDADTLSKLQMPDLIKAQVLSYTANAASLNAGIAKMQSEIDKMTAEIGNIKSMEERNKAEVAALPVLNALRNAQAFLAGKQGDLATVNAQLQRLEVPGAENRAKAEGTPLGTAAAHAKKVGEIGTSIWDTIGGLFKRPSLVINAPKGK